MLAQAPGPSRRATVALLKIQFMHGSLRYNPADIADGMLRWADEHYPYRRGLSPAANRWGEELCGFDSWGEG